MAQASGGQQLLYCATIAHGEQRHGDTLHHRIVANAYDMARAGTLQIEGFPNFGPVLTELKEQGDHGRGFEDAAFQVTVPQADGSLVIREQFFKQFEGKVEEFNEVLEEHNNKFNQEGHRLTVTENPQESSQAGPQMASLVESDDPMTPEKLAALPGASSGCNSQSLLGQTN